MPLLLTKQSKFRYLSRNNDAKGVEGAPLARDPGGASTRGWALGNGVEVLAGILYELIFKHGFSTLEQSQAVAV
jgi:hypothetical protein